MNRFYISMLAVASAFMLSSCEEEGCTDPEALNFNIVADKDDGSCVYCDDAEFNELGRAMNFITDERWGSEFFQEPVLEFDIIQHEKVFVYSDCGQSGCFMDVNVKNITDKEITFLQFFVNVPNTNGFSYSHNQWEMLTLASGEDTTIANLPLAFAPQQYWPFNDNNILFGNINSAEYN